MTATTSMRKISINARPTKINTPKSIDEVFILSSDDDDDDPVSKTPRQSLINKDGIELLQVGVYDDSLGWSMNGTLPDDLEDICELRPSNSAHAAKHAHDAHRSAIRYADYAMSAAEDGYHSSDMRLDSDDCHQPSTSAQANYRNAQRASTRSSFAMNAVEDGDKVQEFADYDLDFDEVQQSSTSAQASMSDDQLADVTMSAAEDGDEVQELDGYATDETIDEVDEDECAVIGAHFGGLILNDDFNRM